MTISDILKKPILPFEIDNENIKKLFSFFLHSAPTIDCTSSANISEVRLLNNWNEYCSYFKNGSYSIKSDGYKIDEKSLVKYNLCDTSIVNKNKTGFICKRKDKNETDYQSVLRHLRNSIAHNNVFLLDAGNRKFIVFDDYNKNKKLSARLLLSQTDLQRLKKIIMK